MISRRNTVAPEEEAGVGIIGEKFCEVLVECFGDRPVIVILSW